jgi:sec-independent protein translocase protein TatB
VFNFNGWEVVIVAVLFILLFGPERLPEVAVQLGRWVRELRQAAEEATADISRELEAAAEEARQARAELEDAGRHARDLLAEEGPRRPTAPPDASAPAGPVTPPNADDEPPGDRAVATEGSSDAAGGRATVGDAGPAE